MSVSDEAVSPQEAKLKFQSQADMGMAQRLQEEEFSHLKEGNVSTSQSRHQTVAVGSKVAVKVALQEETLNMIVETERLKREEMDRKLATKLQDKNSQGQEQAGVQTWLSRELIGFEHTKNRLQERREGEQLAQQLQDEEVANQLQEREDREVARGLEEKEAGEEASLQMALALSRPDTEPATTHLSRTGSDGHSSFSAVDPRERKLPKSRSITNQLSSPNLRSPRMATAPTGPASGKRSHSSTQRTAVKEGEGRNNFRMGRVPHEGHPFLQTPADQQLFREKEHAMLTKTSTLRSPKRSKPPPYSQHSVPRKPKGPLLPMVPLLPMAPLLPVTPATSVPHIPQPPVVPSSSSPVPPVPPSPVVPVPSYPVGPSSSSPVPPVPPSPVVPVPSYPVGPSSSSPVPPIPPSPVVPVPSDPVVPSSSSPVPPVPPSPVVPSSSSPVPPVPPSPTVPSPVVPSSSPVPPVPPSPTVPLSSHFPASPVHSSPSSVSPSPVVSTPSPGSVPPENLQTDTTDTTLETDQSADREESTPPPPPPFAGAAPTKFKHKFRK